MLAVNDRREFSDLARVVGVERERRDLMQVKVQDRFELAFDAHDIGEANLKCNFLR